jgi:hypothetical protein
LLIKRKVKKSEAKILSIDQKHMELVKQMYITKLYGATATFADLLLPFLSDPNIELKCYDTQALHSCQTAYESFTK